MHAPARFLKPILRAFDSRPLGVSCALALLWPMGALANPVDPQVISGQATFNAVGRQLDIANTPGAIINWRGFSINAGEVTRFLQQSSSSAVLNRVVGQDPSRILGALISNGRVFLINPNGIVFGAGARIDTAGLVASTLNLSNQDFAAGRLRFAAGQQGGAIENAGVIKTARGGLVYLIAPQIKNTGLISSPQGQVVLAAGSSVELLDPASPDVRVAVSAPGGQALNLGRIVAASGRIGIYAGLIDQRGIINADSAVRGEHGEIVLRAAGDADLGDGSVVSASGGTTGEGGAVQIVAGGRLNLAQGAQVAVDGGTAGGDGGSLDLSGAQLLLLGSYSGQAHAAGYRNGSLLLDPEHITITSSASTSNPLPASGTLDATATPSNFYIDPASLAYGSWSAIQLSATQDITVSSPIPSLGAARTLSLTAGNNIDVNAPLGSASQPLAADVTLSANNGINLGSSIYLAAGNTLTLSGATQISSSQQITAGHLQAGTFDINSGSLTLDAQANMDGVRLNGSTLTLAGGSLVNLGAARMDESSALVLGQGTQFTNAAGASFVITDDGTGSVTSPYAITQDGNAASFVNLGTLQNANADNKTMINVAFVNSGAVQNDGEALAFLGTTRGGGVFNNASGATLEFSGNASLKSPANLVGGSVVFGKGSQVSFSPDVSTQPGQGALIPVSDNGVPLAVGQIDQPLHGSVIDNRDGTLSYSPAPGFSGSDSFAYELTANGGGTAWAYATVQVGGSIQRPSGLDNSLISQTNALSTTPGLLIGAQKEKRNASSSCN